ncbi:hypothetical protein MNBD_NITROSPINAE01-1291 [hydrothermal vent metagenome]|uniref:Uncharacterized protein n=1 Tax=hydrothermal vent metagenome TaxID=652676 RepID=A0A3B1C0R2_9ZZZZ
MNKNLLFKGFSLGTVAGVLYGLAGIVFNQVTGAFAFEMSITSLLGTFAVGGAIFGVIAGCFMSVTDNLFLKERPVSRAVIISVGFWLALRFGAASLTMHDSHRYHPVYEQSLQGLVLAVILGLILGLLWKTKVSEDIFG